MKQINRRHAVRRGLCPRDEQIALGFLPVDGDRSESTGGIVPIVGQEVQIITHAEEQRASDEQQLRHGSLAW